MKIGEFEISLKTIAVIIVALIVIFGLISIFSGGNSVNINGIEFNIPKAFDGMKQDTLDSSVPYEAYTFENSKTHEFFKIAVFDTDLHSINDAHSSFKKNKNSLTINGKEGLYGYSYGSRIGYYYVDNGKLVTIDVPYLYEDTVQKYDEFLKEIIK